ncbi:MAG: pilin [Candidatus Magasanikbacteria bacterium]
MKKIIATILSLTTMFALALAVTVPLQANATSTLDVNTDLGLSYGASTGLGNTDIRTTIAKIIRVAMSMLGIVAVVIVLIGGFKWMTAGGNDDQVGEAKKWIFSGVIGLVIILSAYALASFVLNQLVNATAGGSI